jgi:hypothetical protein
MLERDDLGDSDFDRKIILERILGKEGGKMWIVCTLNTIMKFQVP